jgi:hypothetical protein
MLTAGNIPFVLVPPIVANWKVTAGNQKHNLDIAMGVIGIYGWVCHLQEHSVNIQGTFREHPGNVQGTFGEHCLQL